MKPFVSILVVGLFCNVVSANKVSVENEKECDSSGGASPQACKGPHEVWSKCGNNSCVKSCATLGLTNIACRPSCGSGCICVEGYYRNAKGICVKPQDCGINICPGKNETFSICVSSCAEKCVTLGRSDGERNCETPQCTPGCDCKSGFFRNTNNECVTPEKCECGVNEEFSKYGRPCPYETCKEFGSGAAINCPAYDPKNPRPPACNCKLNFYRLNGVCIDIRECPPKFECPELTVYEACPDLCVDQRCYKTVVKPAECQQQLNNERCRPRCRCSEGNCEDESRTCVNRDSFVPKCPAANEVFSTCGNDNCVRTCATFGITNYNCTSQCTAGCICDKGYVRETAEGKCIPIVDCEVDVCPEKNMQYSPCVSGCAEDCANLGQNRTCDYIECAPACECKTGFFVNANGECVSPDKCVCGENQVLDMCSYSCPPETCATIGAMFKCSRDMPCTPACKCKLNFKRDRYGNCIDIRECPQPFDCPLPSVYDACEPSCLDERCVKDGPLGCEGIDQSALVCRPYCRCPKGTCKDDTGLCVDDKPYQSCGGDENAMFSACGDQCPRTCANSKDPPTTSCTESCVKGGGCKCKPGFVRDYQKKCIKESECQKCGVNEFFDCGSACDTTCATLGEPCPIINKTCNKKCYCKAGFARNAKNVCIPVKQCPAKSCQGDMNANPADGCKCKSGFVKDKDGKCIVQPSLQCGANEKVDTCALCADQTCAMVFSGEPAKCTKPPGCPVACRCLPGFVRGLSNQCVKPEKCCTDPNSELVASPSPCPGGTCECPTVTQCKDKVLAKGCRCKAGFLKKSAADATCVARKNCPKKTTSY
nr:zonadhesin-like protein 11A [Limnephilus flavicornis]